MKEMIEETTELAACVVFVDSEIEAVEQTRQPANTTECCWCGHYPCGCGG